MRLAATQVCPGIHGRPRAWQAAIALLGCLLVVTGLNGQSPRASVSGIASDPSGRVVPGVQVKLTDVDRGTVYQTQTNDAGFYLLSELNPGTYQVAAQAAGFRTFQVNSFPLSTQQRAVLDIRLEVGDISQKIEVTSQVQLVEASTATLGGVVENKLVTDLPLNNRNVFMLMVLVPGVVPSLPNNYQDESFTVALRYSVNGGLESTTDVQLDGISANAASDIPGIYGLGTLPSVDSIQEFRVQTNSYSAEYGRSGGGVVTMLTKSGTNDLHFDLFEYLRNHAMDANTFISNRSGGKVAQLQRHQFGGSVAGPVFRNKTFFFGTYEQKVQHAGGYALFTVPTALQRQGDFSQTLDAKGNLMVVYNPFTTRADPGKAGQYIRDPFPGNVIPQSRLDPVAVKATSYYPNPNLPGTQYRGANNLGLGAAALSPNRRVDFKIDHNFSDTRRLFLRYNYFKSTSGALNYFNNKAANAYGTMDWKTHNAVLDYTQTFASTVVDIRGGVNRFVAYRPSFANDFDITTLGLPASLRLYGLSGSQPMFPMFTVQDYSSLGPPYQNGAFYSSYNTNYTLIASVQHVRGRHTLKAGADLRSYLLNFLQIDGNFGAAFNKAMTQGPNPLTAGQGDGYASFLLGASSSGYAPFQPKLANASRYFAQYIQDDIKWTSRLTMNIGFRIEEESSATERYNRLTAMDLNVLNPISQQVGFNVYGGYLFAGESGGASLGRRAIRPVEYKMNPRLGIAYQLDPRTTIRTGYGIFYGVTASGPTRRFAGSPFSTSTTLLGTLDSMTPYNLLSNPFPEGYTYPEGSSKGLLAAVGTGLETGLPDQLRTGYNQQWNFTIQRALSQNTMLQLAYAGNKGTHLSAFEWSGVVNANQLRPEYLSRGSSLLTLVANPFYGYVSSGTLAQKQIQAGQLLRPYPEWTSVFPASIGVGNSIYHALQAMFQKRFAGGTSMIASYTWSKNISDVADGEWANGSFTVRNWYCFSCERAVSYYDVPHRFTLSLTSELPFGKGKWIGSNWPGAVNHVLGGWQANAFSTLASGQPLSFSVGTNTSYSLGGNQHPDATGIEANLGSGQTINKWFNTAAFAHPASFTFGNLGRTFTGVRRDLTRNIDVSVFKSFRIVEKLRLEFRAEAFNLTNTPVFAAPNTNVDSSSFGVISSQNNTPRQIQLGLKLIY